MRKALGLPAQTAEGPAVNGSPAPPKKAKAKPRSAKR